MPDKSPKGDVHAWNWLSHISVPCFCAVVASQTNSPIKFGSSCRSWENTLNFKHSMVTDTQARRIITVSNIDQVIFFLIMLTHCFFPATIQLAKCNVPMTRDTNDLAKPLSNKMPCSTPSFDTELVSSWASFNPLDIKKKALRHSCTIPTDCINSTSQDSDMVVQRLPWLEKNGKNSLKMLSMNCV